MSFRRLLPKRAHPAPQSPHPSRHHPWSSTQQVESQISQLAASPNLLEVFLTRHAGANVLLSLTCTLRQRCVRLTCLPLSVDVSHRVATPTTPHDMRVGSTASAIPLWYQLGPDLRTRALRLRAHPQRYLLSQAHRRWEQDRLSCRRKVLECLTHRKVPDRRTRPRRTTPCHCAGRSASKRTMSAIRLRSAHLPRVVLLAAASLTCVMARMLLSTTAGGTPSVVTGHRRLPVVPVCRVACQSGPLRRHHLRAPRKCHQRRAAFLWALALNLFRQEVLIHLQATTRCQAAGTSVSNSSTYPTRSLYVRLRSALSWTLASPLAAMLPRVVDTTGG